MSNYTSEELVARREIIGRLVNLFHQTNQPHPRILAHIWEEQDNVVAFAAALFNRGPLGMPIEMDEYEKLVRTYLSGEDDADKVLSIMLRKSLHWDLVFRNSTLYGRFSSELTGWVRPKANRALNDWAKYIPRRYREAFVGDLREDIEEFRADGWTEKQLVSHVRRQILIAVLLRIAEIAKPAGWIAAIRMLVKASSGHH